MNILGLNGQIILRNGDRNGWGYVHGSGVALFKDGVFCNAASEERFSRKKYDGDFPKKSLHNILTKHGLSNVDIDVVTWIGGASLDLQIEKDKKIKIINFLLKEEFPNAEIKCIDHHLSHAYSTFLISPYEKANVMTFDNCGDTHFFDENNVIKSNFTFSTMEKSTKTFNIHHYNYPSIYNDWFSLGHFYTKMSTIVWETLYNAGIVKGEFGEGTEGKIMGLCAYGDEKNIPFENPFVILQTHNEEFPKIFYKYFINDDRFIGCHAEDIAAWSQKIFSETIINFLRKIPKRFKEDYLCMAGGCSLNVLTNTLILENELYKDVFVPPAPSDEGLPLGAAINEVWQREKQLVIPINLGTVGINYSTNDVIEAVKKVKNVKLNKNCQVINDENELITLAAENLVNHDLIGWFQGASELGPRALGNRSILGNPTKDLKDYLNNNIKAREPWRPYAAVVTEEALHKYFNIPKNQSPYMMFSSTVKEKYRNKLPSITHKDNTCRIQTVNIEQNPKLYKLLKEFERLTGFPILLNTSFNIKGEPIVESPYDALKTFIGCNLQTCIIENVFITKSD
jgi:carbamoyltransferase